MSQLTTSTGSQYSDQDRRRVIASYAVHGSQVIVARQENIPRITVQNWVNSEWGVELLSIIRHETQDEFIAGYTNIIRSNLGAQVDRLENGDVVGLDDYGNPLRQPVRYRDLVVGAGIAVDKLRLLSNQPTSITVTDSALTKISAQLAAYAVDKQANGHTIDNDTAQVVD